MEVRELPYKIFETLDYWRDLLRHDDSKVVVYNTNKFSHIMIENGYLEFNEADALAPHIDHYKFYRLAAKFKNSTHDEILMDLTGKTIEEIMKEKVISITDIPYNFEDVFEALIDADGYFDKVSIDSKLFRNALDFHGFTGGAGTNGYYSYGTKKLKKYCNDNNEYGVIEIITGKTKAENDEILLNDMKTNEIKKMYATAEKYGYNIFTDDELESYEG